MYLPSPLSLFTTKATLNRFAIISSGVIIKLIVFNNNTSVERFNDYFALALNWSPFTSHELFTFPYGLSLIIPIVLFFKFLSFLGFSSIFAVKLAFFVPLLASDYICMLFLQYLVSNRSQILLTSLYWFSPVLILSTYYYGFLDLVPVSLLIISLFLLYKSRLFYSAFFLSICFASKPIFLVCFPFILLYFLKNIYSLRLLLLYSLSSGFFLLLTTIVKSSLGSSLYSADYTYQFEQIFALYVPFSSSVSFFVFPFIYLFTILFFCRFVFSILIS